MASVYLVMVREQDKASAVFIKQGFSWGAFSMPLVWGLLQGLFFWTLLIIFLYSVIFLFLPVALAVVFLFFLNIICALDVAFFQEKHFEKRGYAPCDLVFARNLPEAEIRFFTKEA